MALTEHETPSLIDRFDIPGREFAPLPLWWWSGDEILLDRLQWQLDQLAEGGAAGVVVINLAPSGPLFGAPADSPPWFDNAWWDLFRSMCEHARVLGLQVWFYDQLGFSGANVQGRLLAARPEFSGEALDRVVVEVDSDAELACPPRGRPVAACVLPLDDDGNVRGRPRSVLVKDGVARWRGSGRHRFQLVYARRHGFDYLSPDAGPALLDSVHGEFDRRVSAYLGDPIAGSFQDEFPRLGTWTRRFDEQFAEQHGYDLTDLIAALWDDWGTEARKVRCDYAATRASLAESAFFRPLFEWHDRRGLLVGCDQQSPARGGNPVQSTQLYADYLRTHRWFNAPGSDHNGDAKIHSSLAHRNGHQRVWLEGFHSTGWGGTLEETFDWLLPWLRAGVTLYNPHAVYYSTRRGWFDWAPPSTCWRQPYWRHYPVFARTVARLCSVLSAGQHRCDVAVLFPTSTVQAHLSLDDPVQQILRTREIPPGPATDAQNTYFDLIGTMEWRATSPGVLDQDRRDFDVIDEESLARAEFGESSLVVGDERYQAVVLPACRVLPTDSAIALRRFAERGGIVVLVGTVPEHAAGRDGDDDAVLTFSRMAGRHRNVRFVRTAKEVSDALFDLQRTVDAPVPTLLRQVGEDHVLFVPAIHPRATAFPVRTADGQLDYDFDPSRYARELMVRVRGIPGQPELWDPVSGARHRLSARTAGDGTTEVDVPFRSGPAVLVVFRASPGEPASLAISHAGADNPEEVVIGFEGTWESEIVSVSRCSDDTTGQAMPATVEQWYFEHRAEGDANTELWAQAKATFGEHGLFVGPRATAELPEHLRPGAVDSIIEGVEALAGREWDAAVYSERFGVENDPMHRLQLGPKGTVPDTFLLLPNPGPGEGVQFRVVVLAEHRASAFLAFGAAAQKQVWWNGRLVEPDTGGFGYATPIDLDRGPNVLEVRLTHSEARPLLPTHGPTAPLRAYWALVTDPAHFARAEWIVADDDDGEPSVVSYFGDIDIGVTASAVTLVVASAGAARVSINGVEVGRQGETGFYEGVYDRHPNTAQYDLTAKVRNGRNEIRIDVTDAGDPHAVMIDVAVTDGRGSVRTHGSTVGWRASRGKTPLHLRALRLPWLDPSTIDAAPRPHPLHDAAWSRRDSSGAAVVLPASGVTSLTSSIEWFRFTVPPGATSMRLPVAGEAQCWVDGKEVEILDEAVALSVGHGPLECVVRVVADVGRRGGAVWKEPVSFRMGKGEMTAGDWADAGLGCFSGGIAYRTRVHVDGTPRRATLDLGTVRGSAEVCVNGQATQIGVFAPWTFDLAGALCDGDNELEIRVFNTLGPYLDAVSPTNGVMPSQLRSGMHGPVRLTLTPS